MNRLLTAVLAAALCLAGGAATVTAQRTDSATPQNGAETRKKRPPVFRATREQIKQAQSLLKQRQFYKGEATGKLDAETRAGLRKYQEAEGLKATGTLNRVTLEKMSIALTERQKTM